MATLRTLGAVDDQDRPKPLLVAASEGDNGPLIAALSERYPIVMNKIVSDAAASEVEQALLQYGLSEHSQDRFRRFLYRACGKAPPRQTRITSIPTPALPAARNRRLPKPVLASAESEQSLYEQALSEALTDRRFEDAEEIRKLISRFRADVARLINDLQ